MRPFLMLKSLVVTASLLFLATLPTPVEAIIGGCTPKYANCSCTTAANLTCAELAAMRLQLVNFFNSLLPSADIVARDPVGSTVRLGRFKGSIIRLVFHDAAEYNHSLPDVMPDGTPRYRVDGCIDEANFANAGLKPTIDVLDALWIPFCTRISLADYWVFSAKVAIEESCPYVQSAATIAQNVMWQDVPIYAPLSGTSAAGGVAYVANDSFRVTNFSLPFFTGRIDRVKCPTPSRSAPIPNAEGGVAEIRRTLMNNLGFDAPHAVALLGAHTMGGASASGYNGTWKPRADLFTTQFFKALLLSTMRRSNMSDPLNSRNQLLQWNATDTNVFLNANSAASAPQRFMLTSDMSLVYDADHLRDATLTPAQRAALPVTCGPTCGGVAAIPVATPATVVGAGNKCPFTKLTSFFDPATDGNTAGGGSTPATFAVDFEAWVRYYAEGDISVGDQPGANRWLSAFSRAFVYLTSIGYAPSALQCVQCSPSVASYCTDDSCNTPAGICGLNNAFNGSFPLQGAGVAFIIQGSSGGGPPQATCDANCVLAVAVVAVVVFLGAAIAGTAYACVTRQSALPSADSTANARREVDVHAETYSKNSRSVSLTPPPTPPATVAPPRGHALGL